MLALILIAIHFAMQVYAQQEAKRLVSLWAEKGGITVSDVRYRMLRGALTLVNVQLKRDSIDVRMPSLFLHGSLTSLAGEVPEAGYVEIRGAKIIMSGATLKHAVEMRAGTLPDVFYQTWSAARRVGVYDSSVTLLPEKEAQLPAAPTVLHISRVESKRMVNRRMVSGLLRTLDGELNLTTEEDTAQDEERFHGRLSWKGIRANSLLGSVMGLSSIPGSLDGHIAWHSKGSEKNSYSVSGSTLLSGMPDNDRDRLLEWQGLLISGAWIGEIKAAAWPLAPFAEQLPRFQHYQAVSGDLDGIFKFAGDWRQWKIETAEARLADVQYAATMAEESGMPQWHAAAIRFADTSLHWPDRILRAKKASLDNLNVVVDARGVELPKQSWKVDIREIGLNQLVTAIRLTDEQLFLPPISGDCRWRKNNRVSLHLRTQPSDEEKWEIQGEGVLGSDHASPFKLKVAADRATLVRFRPLLPKLLRRDASDISGKVKLKLNLLAGSQPWEASGEAEVSSTMLQYGGEAWSADLVKIVMEKIGAAIAEQQFSQVDVQGWQYQAALRPATQSEPKEAEETEAKEQEISPDHSVAEPWHIKLLQMNNGRVSVGHADGIWLKEVNVRVKGLRPESYAPIDLKALLDDGRLSVQGQLTWRSSLPELYKVKVTVRDALPFFMNDWLEVSGSPQLMRGRLYADLKMQRGEQGEYKGLGYFRVQQGLPGPAHSEKDLFLARIGFHAHDIFSTLGTSGQLRLRIPLAGAGDVMDVIADSFMATLKAEMEKQGGVGKGSNHAKGETLSSVRLHESGMLSHNERVRLRKALAYLKKNPKIEIALRPQLSLSSDDGLQVERVRYTQGLIEDFLVNRGVSRSRIFPVWPGEQHRISNSTSGVGIVTLP